MPQKHGYTPVPLARFEKRSFRGLDVRDASGLALPVWTKEQNTNLGVRMLSSLLPVEQAKAEVRALTAIVEADSAAAASQDIERLFPGVTDADHSRASDEVDEVERSTHPSDEDLARKGAALEVLTRYVRNTFAKSLADGFLFVVDVPAARSGQRHLVKAEFDFDLMVTSEDRGYRWLGVTSFRIQGAGVDDARSWHLEVVAPPGMSVAELGWIGPDGTEHSDPEPTRTGHVRGSRYRDTKGGGFSALVSLVPVRAGLVNQTMLTTALAAFATLAVYFFPGPLSNRITDSTTAAAVATVACGLPALMIALFARGPEHQVVSLGLAAPRAVALLCAGLLWLSGFGLLFQPDEDALRLGAWAVGGGQTILAVWACGIRGVARDS